MKLRRNRWYIDLKQTLTTNDLSVTLKQTKQRRLCNSASQLHIFILFVRNSKGILFETRCICPRDLGFPSEWYGYNVCYSLEKKKVCWIKEEHVTPMTSRKIPSIPAAGFPTPAPYHHQTQPCSRLTLPPASPKCVDSWPLTPKYPPQKIIKIWESNSQLYFIKDQIVDQWNGLKSLL